MTNGKRMRHEKIRTTVREKVERGGKGHRVGRKKDEMVFEYAEKIGIPLETVTPP